VWAAKPDMPWCNDPLYVMIYDYQTVLDATTAANHPECIEEDGFARTIIFVRFEEFSNW
jgi:hypothetical protein